MIKACFHNQKHKYYIVKLLITKIFWLFSGCFSGCFCAKPFNNYHVYAIRTRVVQLFQKGLNVSILMGDHIKNEFDTGNVSNFL